VGISLGGLQIPNVDLANLDLSNLDLGELDLGNIEDSIKNVAEFIDKNPVGAAAMALGAGVVLTSLYWDKMADKK